MRAERILYRLAKTYCRRCNKTVQARAPGVLPKTLVGNQLITQVVLLHYRHGIPLSLFLFRPSRSARVVR